MDRETAAPLGPAGDTSCPNGPKATWPAPPGGAAGDGPALPPGCGRPFGTASGRDGAYVRRPRKSIAGSCSPYYLFGQEGDGDQFVSLFARRVSGHLSAAAALRGCVAAGVGRVGAA